MPTSKRSIILGRLYMLFVFSLMSTVTFWIITDSKSEKSPVLNIQNEMNSRRRLRSLGAWVNLSNIALDHFNPADLFAIKPGVAVNVSSHSVFNVTTVSTRIKSKHKENATSGLTRTIHPYPSRHEVCPEIDIPKLECRRTVNLSDIPIKEVESILLGDKVNSFKRLLEKTNFQIDMLKTEMKVHENKGFVPCNKSTTSEDKCGNTYLQDILGSHQVRVNNYVYTPGGIWKPNNCVPRWKVAVIIPYRDRAFHLPILIRHLTPMMQRQKLQFGFYVVEQANNLKFNRAMLMNVGFLESLNFTKWDCFILHDVDHIPLCDLNYYGCSGMPRHFLSGADRWTYKLPYLNFFGAVTGLTRTQIYTINGFPNVYWGWGGEDDEIWERVKSAGLEITRPKGRTGYYNVIRHHHRSAPAAINRFSLLRGVKRRSKNDGLNNLVYSKCIVTLNTLYTNISVDIRQVPSARRKVDTAAKARAAAYAESKARALAQQSKVGKPKAPRKQVAYRYRKQHADKVPIAPKVAQRALPLAQKAPKVAQKAPAAPQKAPKVALKPLAPPQKAPKVAPKAPAPPQKAPKVAPKALAPPQKKHKVAPKAETEPNQPLKKQNEIE